MGGMGMGMGAPMIMDPNLPRCYICSDIARGRCYGRTCGFKPCGRPVCRMHMRIAITKEDMRVGLIEELCVQCYPRFRKAQCVLALVSMTISLTLIIIFCCCYQP